MKIKYKVICIILLIAVIFVACEYTGSGDIGTKMEEVLSGVSDKVSDSVSKGIDNVTETAKTKAEEGVKDTATQVVGKAAEDVKNTVSDMISKAGGTGTDKSTNTGSTSDTNEAESETDTGTATDIGTTTDTGSTTGTDATEEEIQAAQAALTDYFGKTDAVTGNEFSFRYTNTVIVEGTSYYIFEMSWLVGKGEDGAHFSYLDDVAVSKDLSFIGEYYEKKVYPFS